MQFALIRSGAVWAAAAPYIYDSELVEIERVGKASLRLPAEQLTFIAMNYWLRSWRRHELDSDTALITANLAADFLYSSGRVLGV